MRVTNRITFLGEIPREIDFEAKTTPFVQEDGRPDFVMDDSAVVVTEGDGIVVISGCAHAGICNTIAHARRVTGKARMKAVVGGFHLGDDAALVRRTVQYFRDNNIERVLPCHCTGALGIRSIQEAGYTDRVYSGASIEIT